MSTVNVQENAVGYASLILTDQNLDVTADKLIAIAKAANITLQPIWAQTFERVLKGRSLTELLEAATSGGGGGGAAPAAADAAPAAAVAEVAAPVEEEGEEEMELDLFG
eukprot:392425_1